MKRSLKMKSLHTALEMVNVREWTEKLFCLLPDFMFFSQLSRDFLNNKWMPKQSDTYRKAVTKMVTAKLLRTTVTSANLNLAYNKLI